MLNQLGKILLASVVAFMLLGCDKAESPKVASAERLAPISESDSVSLNQNISEAEAAEFGAAWETAVAEGDVAASKTLIWFDKMLDRVIASFELEPKYVAGFKQGANSGSPIAKLVGQLKANQDAGGSYRLVRVVTRAGDRHAVFRLLGANGALNYHDLRIVRDGDQLRADKIFVAMTGEKISDSMKTAMAPLVQKLTPMARMMGGDQRELKLLEKQSAVMKSIVAGDMAGALDLYGKLPADVQKRKMIQVYRLTALAQLAERETEYLQAMDQYAELFPGDPSLALISIDAAVLRDDMDLLIKAHGDLTTWSAGDPILDLIVGAVLANSGRPEEAQAMVADVDPASLGLESAHDYRLAIALGNDDHPETLKQLTALRDNYGYEFQDLSTAEGFESFVRSPEHVTWTGGAQ